MTRAASLKRITDDLVADLDGLVFEPPTAFVYNPLVYARAPWDVYCRKYGKGQKEVLLVGMNPGPFGMAQVGVPFGEVNAVRDWLGIRAKVGKPPREHPKRPILGFDCTRSEVSGRRLWSWAEESYGTPEAFFERFFIANYCPLVFMEEGGRNRIPEKLPKSERAPLFAACDRALRRTVEKFQPRYVVGVGKFAEKKARAVVGDLDLIIGSVPHPSPASPLANRGWAPLMTKALEDLGIHVPSPTKPALVSALRADRWYRDRSEEMAMRNVGALFTLSLLLVAGCTNSDFIGDGVAVFAMADTTPPIAVGRRTALFMVESRIELPIREPSRADMRELTNGASGITIPWTRLPWVQEHDYEIQLDYVISNLEDRTVTTAFTVNGFNEFEEYVPSFTPGAEGTTLPDFAGYERNLVLAPFERVAGTVREEEMDEIAVDLATIVNGVPNSNEVLHPNNQSQHDPRSQAFIPEVIPALTGFRVGLRAESEAFQGEIGEPPTFAPPPRLVAEVSVLVRDESGRIVSQSDAWVLPVPTIVYPIVPVEE